MPSYDTHDSARIDYKAYENTIAELRAAIASKDTEIAQLKEQIRNLSQSVRRDRDGEIIQQQQLIPAGMQQHTD